MNKHMIILPLLLTSAVSLHALSYYLEEPDDIAQIPSPVSSASIEPSPLVSSQVTASVTVAVKPVSSAEPVKSPLVVASKDSGKNVQSKPVETVIPVKPQKTANVTQPVSSPTAPVKTPVPVVKETTVPEVEKSENKIATAFIPTKNFLDIVREAKVIGGRVDPFLSMNPPEIEKIPELPEAIVSQPPIEETKPYFPDNEVKRKPGKKSSGSDKISPPASAWVPSFDNAKPSGKKNVPDKIAGKTSKSPGKKDERPDNIEQKEDEIIIFKQREDIVRDLALTGIITGSKPIAIILVDGESKPFGVGDYIRKDKKIKLVKIDFSEREITVIDETISDEKKRRARLKLKED